MAKNVVLLTRRRLELEEPTSFIVTNSHGLKSREASFIKNDKKIDTSFQERAQVVIFRKISSLRNNNKKNYIPATTTITANINNQKDKRQTFKSLVKKSTPNTKVNQNKNPQNFDSTSSFDNKENCVPTIIIKTHRSAVEATTNVINDNNKTQHDTECLFCKYERVLSSDKLPNFARKRLSEVFQSLSTPKPETSNRQSKKKNNISSEISNQNKFINILTRSNISFESSLITTSQIFE
jgi:hypothetical protein